MVTHLISLSYSVVMVTHFISLSYSVVMVTHFISLSYSVVMVTHFGKKQQKQKGRKIVYGDRK
jgi:uncharacterized membrane protein